jgi:hypothetical protein
MNTCIYEIQNCLSPDFCKELINAFNTNPEKYVGATMSGISSKIKKTKEIYITDLAHNRKDPAYITYDKHLRDKLYEHFHSYQKYLISKNFANLCILDYIDSGFQIQEYKAGEGFYHWHDDYSLDMALKERCFTYLWYLNTVTDGGETEFIDGTKIKPEEGKLIFFPACKTFVHRGNMPYSSNKYICTGWIYSYAKISDVCTIDELTK